MEHIYLDHAATTPIHPSVIQRMTDVMKTTYGNPSSVHAPGRAANKIIEEARQLIAAYLNVNSHEIIFTSGGTEGDNTAIIQTALLKSAQGKHIITTEIEHPAVLQSMAYLANLGYDITYLQIDRMGNISIEEFKKALREDTILVSIMYGNNEIGNLLPIKEIGELLRNHSAVFHTDAVQAFGLEKIYPHELGIDLLNVSAHKINGPKGVGFLYKKDGLQIAPFLHGGEQEEKRRAGTENVPGIAGMVKAVELLTESENVQKKEKYKTFQTIILSELETAKISYQVNGDSTNKMAHILNLWIKGVPNNLLLMNLDLIGISVSTGSACTAGTVEPSTVLKAMYGETHEAIHESIRISFGLDTTESQIERFVQELIKIVQKLV